MAVRSLQREKIEAVLRNYGSEEFDHAVRSGIAYFVDGDHPGVAPTAEQIVQFIKDNITEAEWKIDDEQLLRSLGFLIGWVLGEYTIAH